MSKQTTTLTYVEIDNLIESIDKDSFKDIKWKTFTEEEIESLLKTS
ncbi:hypothetical protein [Desertibacillus haloalkaliphilus]|nr:hypothetical protein [Desertibacillus haloalkaliphilus]MBU8908305.1 hypothetical protein [Desertibacillus haloalkaliphilus]